VTLAREAAFVARPHTDAEPFFFGRASSLFGLHYQPTAGRLRDVAVLLCYPLGHEYIVAHRAYRQLSMLLAGAGMHVMRFDYYGCGDSTGECEAGTPRRWMSDVSTAIDELRARADCSEICLVGCRLGATLCTIAAADRADIEHMVLWDPVVNGSDHVNEIVRRHRDMLKRTHVRSDRTRQPGEPQELLGIACGTAALREIEALDLLTLRNRPASRVLVIDSHRADTTGRLRERLEHRGATVTHHRIPVARAWTWIEDGASVLVPHQILTAAQSWIAASCA
jgi:alpha/beta superfamily hydrolase